MHEMRVYEAATERYCLVPNNCFVLRTKLIQGTANVDYVCRLGKEIQNSYVPATIR